MLQAPNLTPEQEIELAYLNLDFGNLLIDLDNNPLLKDYQDPVRRLLEIFRNPEYLHFTFKVLFNIDLLPIQVNTLIAVMNHSFPLLVASRGFGKSTLLAFYIECLSIRASKS